MRALAGALFVCLLGWASCISHKNTLHFKAHDEGQKQMEQMKDVGVSNGTTNSTCPDKKYFCTPPQTCCRGPSAKLPYVCCPYPKGVCCNDGVHCCQMDTLCDEKRKGCIRRNKNGYQFFAAVETLLVSQLDRVVCPGGSSYCPDGQTCCQLASGQWGCCPIPNALCCSDHLHCCPDGYKCDVLSGRCSKGNQIKAWFSKQPATDMNKVNNVVCPGGSSYCPDGQTCCQLPSGQWGCCPIPKAVCCSDHQHCCPNGYKCDVSAGTCTHGTKIMAWLSKQPSNKMAKVNKVDAMTCPGRSAQCPDEYTCCLLASGQWGCCPLPKAVCCSDKIHCCPNGHTCDLSKRSCSQGDILLPWFSKQPSTLTELTNVKVQDMECPGGQSQCPDGNTCCELSSKDYGCCPYANANCCSDKLQCCPNGMVCNLQAGTCDKGWVSIPFHNP